MNSRFPRRSSSPPALPTIRAAFLHSNLEALGALGPAVAERVRARIPSEVLRDADEAARTAWLPVEHDVVLTEAIEQELGRAAMRAWARDGVLRATEAPLLAPIARSARAIFGITPHAFLRRAPQAWSVLYRDCGQMEYAETSSRSARVGLVGAPTAITRSVAYVEGLAAGLEAAMKLGGADGAVEIAVDAAARTARYSCAW
ncbi:hypothetical protein [Sandaracinus amylolyticus]|uniref:hypothetical protein n=1 Tax=Sandaracinus amylolyticus TaxID=927083 RepID=UPI001F46005F|nr:hypothetical protein [Sandaracinus amylolyticus]UJR82275.1 Hypothetical protein I5071_43400 [Sandaracinus amylolyticus]